MTTSASQEALELLDLMSTSREFLLYIGDSSIFGKRLIACVPRLKAELAQGATEFDRRINTPETEDFFRGVPLEAAHQRERWPSEHDVGKEPADWFWLIGYLAGKCLAAHIAGNREKALHHTISTAAALANWHRAIKGAGNMRPGIEAAR